MNPGMAPPDEPARQRRARSWRGVIAMGGLVLASTFFMPAVPGCNEPIIPAQEVEEAFSAPSSHHWVEVAQAFVLFIAAYLWGLLIAISALARLVRGSPSPRWCNWAEFGVLGLTTVTLIIVAGAEFLHSGMPTLFTEPAAAAFCFGIFPTVLAYLMMAWKRLGRRAYLAVSFVGAMAASAWFSGWVLDGYYGVRLSFAASLVILVGVIGESAVLTRRGWLGTIWRLVTCRLRDADIAKAACPKCQYDLRGAAEMRCPECGRPFSFEELGLWPEEVGFGQRLGAE